MLEHHIQKNIVYKLAFAQSMKFSELKPDGIENKLFDYHLKAVIKNGFAEKTEAGRYRLTPEGRRLGSRALDKQMAAADRAESILILAIRKIKGEWLLYRRSTHPLLGKSGFMHLYPENNLKASESAKNQIKSKLGLNCEFKPLGSGFFRTFNNNELESFVNFNFLICNDAQGDLNPDDERASYYWQADPDFESDDMIPNMKILSEKYFAGEMFFLDEELNY